MATKKEQRRLRIKHGIRSKVSGTSEKPRLTVFRSNTGIYAQLIDDTQGKTLVSASSQELENKNANISVSKTVGQKLAEKAVSSGISTVVFDRNGYLFHGKVKALAEGAREGGLKF
ncbi:50S ribosomal protein L18 [Rhodocytophaga rosea]|uniref:Large ribosomal subunit protein uL18 n=1 Tax=Rhodocytophaga rosea TaxID=2704465 RepID=A0A6C0GN79_9BACT|nr:50S ribosomal protein L18 [Rhodocytophaga rosea]QHT69090.1 50S ribosomal protein L18 [Rhodocytophaga rosea]